VQNDPENTVDPLGLEECAIWATYAVYQRFTAGGVVIREPELLYTYSSCLLGANVSKVGDGSGSGSGGERRGGLGDSLFEKALRKALDLVKEILTKENSCSDFFGPNALPALEALGSILKPASSGGVTTPTGIKMEFDANTPLVGGGYRVPIKATVYTNGPFYMGQPEMFIGGYARGTMGAATLALLHELAHMIQKPDGSGFLIPGDGHGDSQSPTNTQTVLDHCKQQVFEANKKT
jgi:hypothetical protein